MKLRYSTIIILILPLLLTGCIFSSKDKIIEPIELYNKYESQKLEGFSFVVKYLKNWQVEETSTDKFGDYKDTVVFKGEDENIKIIVLDKKDKQSVLDNYNIESESQTDVAGILGSKIFGTIKENSNERFAAVLLENGKFLIHLTSNSGSGDFIRFLNDMSITKLAETKSADVTVTLYFDNINSGGMDCEAKSTKKVTIIRPGEDLGLIPQVVQLLIQLSVPEDLANENLITAIPINTRILSFGYEDNRAIVNFNDELNEGGGSCEMKMRRSQIEKTLIALNEVSDLEIKDVEIQVEGDSETAIQP